MLNTRTLTTLLFGTVVFFAIYASSASAQSGLELKSDWRPAPSFRIPYNQCMPDYTLASDYNFRSGVVAALEYANARSPSSRSGVHTDLQTEYGAPNLIAPGRQDYVQAYAYSYHTDRAASAMPVTWSPATQTALVEVAKLMEDRRTLIQQMLTAMQAKAENIETTKPGLASAIDIVDAVLSLHRIKTCLTISKYAKEGGSSKRWGDAPTPTDKAVVSSMIDAATAADAAFTNLNRVLLEKYMELLQATRTEFAELVSNLSQGSEISAAFVNVFGADASDIKLVSEANAVQARRNAADALAAYGEKYWYMVTKPTSDSDYLQFSSNDEAVLSQFTQEYRRIDDSVRRNAPISCETLRQNSSFGPLNISTICTQKTKETVQAMIRNNANVPVNREQLKSTCEKSLNETVCACLAENLNGHFTSQQYSLFLQSPLAFARHVGWLNENREKENQAAQHAVKIEARRRGQVADAGKGYGIRTGAEIIGEKCGKW